MSDTTLAAMRTLVRRVTRSPSVSQLPNADIDEYINTFILYDFPSTMRLFSLRTTLNFFTQPYVDTYATNTTNPADPLYDFKNKYTVVHPPVYIAGVPGFYTQNRVNFYSSWPQTNYIADTQLRGFNAAGPYVGTLTSIPAKQQAVTFTALDATGTAMVLTDNPVSNLLGALGLPGVPQLTLPSPYGQINYVTGVYTLTFPAVVPLNTVIYSETIPYKASKPTGMLYYDNKFVLRPIPDKAYSIIIEADARPTELLLTTDVPNEGQWWQYVALGAAIKVFRDRMDMDSIQLIWPEFQRQEAMVSAFSTQQYANQRANTIYSQGKMYSTGFFFNSGPY